MRLSASPKTILILLVFTIAAVAGVVYWLKAIHPFEATDNTYLKAHMSLISPTGYVKDVLFEDNRKVQPGDLLVVIDDHDFQARVAQAQAQVSMETARIQILETHNSGLFKDALNACPDLLDELAQGWTKRRISIGGDDEADRDSWWSSIDHRGRDRPGKCRLRRLAFQAHREVRHDALDRVFGNPVNAGVKRSMLLN